MARASRFSTKWPVHVHLDLAQNGRCTSHKFVRTPRLRNNGPCVHTLADIFLRAYAPPDPGQCWHLRKRASSAKNTHFSKIGMKKSTRCKKMKIGYRQKIGVSAWFLSDETFSLCFRKDSWWCADAYAPKWRRDPPDPKQCCGGNRSFSLKETPGRANSEPWINASGMCEASNIVWGPGAHRRRLRKHNIDFYVNHLCVEIAITFLEFFKKFSKIH